MSSTSGRSSRSTLIATNRSFRNRAISSSSNDSSSMTWHQWQVEYPMLTSTGRFSLPAFSNASSPQGYQSTGLCACWSRYGLVSRKSRFVYFARPSGRRCLVLGRYPSPLFFLACSNRSTSSGSTPETPGNAMSMDRSSKGPPFPCDASLRPFVFFSRRKGLHSSRSCVCLCREEGNGHRLRNRRAPRYGNDQSFPLCSRRRADSPGERTYAPAHGHGYDHRGGPRRDPAGRATDARGAVRGGGAAGVHADQGGRPPRQGSHHLGEGPFGEGEVGGVRGRRGPLDSPDKSTPVLCPWGSVSLSSSGPPADG